MIFPLFPAAILASLLLVIVFAVLLAIAVHDARTRKITNHAVLSVLTLYVPFAFLVPQIAEPLFSIGIAIVVFLFTFFCFTRNWLGGGDAKLIPVVALWVGYLEAPLFLLVMVYGGVVLAAAILLLTRVRQKRNRMNGSQDKKNFKFWRQLQLPYGVAIAGAGITVMGLHYGPLLFAAIQAG